ncbi:hypothetical protein GCM10027269_77600 [Kribbella endophytica]
MFLMELSFRADWEELSVKLSNEYNLTRCQRPAKPFGPGEKAAAPAGGRPAGAEPCGA